MKDKDLFVTKRVNRDNNEIGWIICLRNVMKTSVETDEHGRKQKITKPTVYQFSTIYKTRKEAEVAIKLLGKMVKR